MDIESYRSTLNSLDYQISDMENKIRNIRNEISETEQAKESSRRIRNDFDGFVSRKKHRNSRDTRGRLVKSFSSFINKVSNLLSGPEYTKANDQIEEISRLLNSKLNTLYNDLEYCNQELIRLRNRRDSTYADYLSLLNSMEE